jgi:hypothetical protein
MTRTCRALTFFSIVLLVGSVAWAQSSTSPQGGAAIFQGAAVCVSSGSNTTAGPLNPPCTDSSNNGQWFTVMNASLKTSNTTDLFISPSLVTGLYTNTQVKGKTSGTPDSETATAVGSVAVRVLLDCTDCAAPGDAQGSTTPSWRAAGYPDNNGSGIVYDARIQQLTATLGQAITSTCLDLVALTNSCPAEVIDLILDTTSAHTFNFILLNVGSGQHTITVQARLNTGAICYDTNGSGGTCSASDVVNTTLGTSVSAALFGLGSVTVMPVHLAPGFSF